MISTFEPPPHLTMQLTGNDAAGTGRRAVAALFAAAESDLRDDAVLVVSELVTNAITAAQECSLSVWFLRSDRAVRIEVTDRSADPPAMREPDDGRVGGHGLRIVDHISTGWGVDYHDVGKTIWSEIEST